MTDVNAYAWRQRLRDQLPGWAVWYTGGGYRAGDDVKWHAAPAPPGTHSVDYRGLPGQITAETPTELRALARERYGWDDYCLSCGVLARECGHRQPERDPRGT